MDDALRKPVAEAPLTAGAREVGTYAKTKPASSQRTAAIACWAGLALRARIGPCAIAGFKAAALLAIHSNHTTNTNTKHRRYTTHEPQSHLRPDLTSIRAFFAAT